MMRRKGGKQVDTVKTGGYGEYGVDTVKTRSNTVKTVSNTVKMGWIR